MPETIMLKAPNFIGGRGQGAGMFPVIILAVNLQEYLLYTLSGEMIGYVNHWQKKLFVEESRTHFAASVLEKFPEWNEYAMVFSDIPADLEIKIRWMGKLPGEEKVDRLTDESL